MKAYVGIADRDGLRAFVPEGGLPDELMIHDARAAKGRGWVCFWAAVDEGAADQVGEDFASGRRRDAMNLLCVLATEIVRHPASIAVLEAGPVSPPGIISPRARSPYPGMNAGE